MNTDDNMRTPTFEDLRAVANAAFLEELACLRTQLVDNPVQVFHPVLPIAQQPVVESDKTCGEMVGLFDGANYSHSVRLALEKPLHPGNNRRSRRTMAATRVGRND